MALWIAIQQFARIKRVSIRLFESCGVAQLILPMGLSVKLSGAPYEGTTILAIHIVDEFEKHLRDRVVNETSYLGITTESIT
jgi:hypothetical protein